MAGGAIRDSTRVSGSRRQRIFLEPMIEMLRREYAGRRFFAIPDNDTSGGIRLDLAGREPRGRVRKDEVESVCAELERELRSLTNLDTGGPAVTRVLKASDHYERRPMDNLPDLFVEWNGDRPVVRVDRHRPAGGGVGARARADRAGAGRLCRRAVTARPPTPPERAVAGVR